MDFLGPDYKDLLKNLHLYQDQPLKLLDQLVQCEPRASLDIYPSSKVSKDQTRPQSSQKNAKSEVTIVTTDEKGKKHKKDSNTTKGDSKEVETKDTDLSVTKNTNSITNKSPKSDTNEDKKLKGKGAQNKIDHEQDDNNITTSPPIDDVEMISPPGEKVSESASKEKKNHDLGVNLHKDKGKSAAAPDTTKSPSSSSQSVTEPFPEGLESYISLYIWTLLSFEKFLEAKSIAKRYAKTPIFEKSPIVVASVVAATNFSDSFSSSLAYYSTPSAIRIVKELIDKAGLKDFEINLSDNDNNDGGNDSPLSFSFLPLQYDGTSSEKEPISEADSYKKIRELHIASGSPSYRFIYSLNRIFPWDNTVVGGSLTLSALVSRTLDRFQLKTYEKIKKSFTVIRLGTLKYYLGLPSEWTSLETLEFFKTTLKEKGLWKIKPTGTQNNNEEEKSKEVDEKSSSSSTNSSFTTTTTITNKEDLILLIPPSPSLQQKSKRKSSSSSKSSEINSKLQALVNAASHLEQKITP